MFAASRMSLPLVSRRLLSTRAGGSFPYARAISMGIGATLFMVYVANTPVFALTRGVSAEDVARHNTISKGFWLPVNGQVYDLSDYAAKHPVDAQQLLWDMGKNTSVPTENGSLYEALRASKHLGPLVGDVE